MDRRKTLRPGCGNLRGIRGNTAMEAKQVFVPVALSARVRSAAWTAGATQQDWMLAAVREKLEREGMRT